MEKKRKREPWLFLLPVLVVLLLLFGYPLINSIVMAFQNYKLTAPNDIYFNGFENFKKLFGDPDGLMILKNSIIYVVISVAGQFLLGLTLALALKKQFKGRGLYQSIVFLPWAFSGFVVGLIFRWSFNGEYGVVNNLLPHCNPFRQMYTRRRMWTDVERYVNFSRSRFLISNRH